MAEEGGGGEWKSRVVQVDNPEQNHADKSVLPRFVTNEVITSHYTWYNFLIKNFYEQFQKLPNCYFALVCGLQTINAISVTYGRPTNLVGFVPILLIQLIKDCIEDWGRHAADKVENHRLTQVKRGTGANAEFTPTKWKDVKAGQIVKVSNRELIPADLVLLKTPTKNNDAQVMTANLDGETNLKVKEAHKDVVAQFEKIGQGCSIQADTPNKDLERFKGNFTMQDGTHVALQAKNIVLRGTQLRNTDWVEGVVVYTGKQAKISMNAAPPPTKRSWLSKFINQTLLFAVLGVQIALSLIAGIIAAVYAGQPMATKAWYLCVGYDDAVGFDFPAECDENSPGLEVLLRFGSYNLSFVYLVPISLLVTLSFIQTFQANMMMSDIDMYHEDTNKRMLVRTSSLNEELGMVNHVFSDKTGTLTCNMMEFRKCTINGTQYGQGYTEIARAVMRSRGQTVPDDPLPDPSEPKTHMVQFVDSRLRKVMKNPEAADNKKANEFFLGLALNHTVMPEEGKKGEIVYSASSPDEAALLYGAKHFGYDFVAKNPTTLSLIVGDPTTPNERKQKDYALLNTIEFTSTRKRSSVVVKREDGSYVLYCKGADNKIKERLGPTDQQVLTATDKDLSQYSEDGLRALLIAKRELSADFYKDFSARFHAAETDLSGSEEEQQGRVADVVATLEKDLELLGITAIEDKLQAGVPQCIDKLLQAEVKVWMLTGDRVTTAINIGYACALLTAQQIQLRLVGEDNEVKENGQKNPDYLDRKSSEDKDDGTPDGTPTKKALLDRMDQFLAGIQASETYALIVDTYALEGILAHRCAPRFLEVCAKCRSVVCARVSPDQKGQVVSAMRAADPNVITLSIGDGANDVPMIQRAHIGIGISGLEGLQAVNNSDFAIAQFRFLQRLLLLHGRWTMRRLGYVGIYMFYKAILFCLPQFFLGFYCMMSGQVFYYDAIYQAFNITFTGLPPLLYGVFTQDLGPEHAMKYPLLYREAKDKKYVSVKLFMFQYMQGFVQAFIIFFFAMGPHMMGNPVQENGKHWSLYDVGSMVNLVVVIVANVNLMIDMKYWHPLLPLWIFLSVTSWPWMFAIAVRTGYGGSTFTYLVYGTEDVIACSFSVLYTILAVLSCALVHIGFESCLTVLTNNPLGSQVLMERYYGPNKVKQSK